MKIEEHEYDSSNIWRDSRYSAGKSQEYMANYLGVSRKTIVNWESGKSAPDFNQAAKWFECLGVNPLPYFLAFLYPQNLDGISAASDDETISKALDDIIEELPIRGKRQLLYLFYGDHGSSPRSVLELLTAHLHLPMKDRVSQAGVILNNYEMLEARGELVCPEHIRPDVENIHRAIDAAKNAAIENKTGYVIEKR